MTRERILFILFFLAGQVIFGQDTSVKKTIEKKTVPAAELVRGPYLQMATSNTMTVRWRTNAYARSRVRYGTSPDSLTLSKDDSALATEHIVTLNGLQSNTRYYYSVGGIKNTFQGGSDNYFYTLPLPKEKGYYRIGLFGDCGTNSVYQWKVKDQFLKYLGNNYLTSWLLLGDNAYPNGEDAQYQQNFFDVYKDDLLKKYPMFPAPGNHDYHDVEFSPDYAKKKHEIAYYKNFSMPVNGECGGVPSHNQAFYSFDIGNIHFLSVDSYGEEKNQYRLYDTLGPQVEWVKKDLGQNTNRDWVIVFWHHPPYTMGTHNSDKEAELIRIRENFIRILERSGVDMVICGHSHAYERTGLIKGHYGFEDSFDAKKHQIGKSVSPYIKNKNNEGTVYVVTGSAGQTQVSKVPATYPHNAMVYSNTVLTGACILEVQENRLDLKWIAEDGTIPDQFSMIKNMNKNQSTISKKRKR